MSVRVNVRVLHKVFKDYDWVFCRPSTYDYLLFFFCYVNIAMTLIKLNREIQVQDKKYKAFTSHYLLSFMTVPGCTVLQNLPQSLITWQVDFSYTNFKRLSIDALTSSSCLESVVTSGTTTRFSRPKEFSYWIYQTLILQYVIKQGNGHQNLSTIHHIYFLSITMG